jgi:hypothetical protein
MAKRDRANRKNKRPRLQRAALLNNLLLGSSITYSKKWPDQAGHRDLQNLKLKVPELLGRLGLSDGTLIEKHLKPQLNAYTVKFFQHKGKVTDKRIVPDNDARLKALDMALKLSGAYAQTDPTLAQPVGVQVILVDVPRPGRPDGRSLSAPTNPQLPSPEDRS